MKLLKKMMTVLAVIIICMMMVTTVSAQTVANDPVATDDAKITINNPAKGETYTLYKLFDATVSSDGTKIAYQGTVPEGLANFFEADANGNVTPKESIVEKDEDGKVIGTKMTDDLKAALETWANGSAAQSSKIVEAESNGDGSLEFSGLPYGYYVVITTHTSDPVGDAEAKSAITVCSTKPNATINDKNVNEPSAKKEADKESYSIGDVVTYTATFDAPNYMKKEGTGTAEGESEQVVSYTITDTLPDFLDNVTVTKVEIKQPGVAQNVEVTPRPSFEDGKFDVKWVREEVPTTNHEYTSLYKANSQIIVTYTAALTSNAQVGAPNENKVSIMPNVDRGNEKVPYQNYDKWNDTETITTHAAALIKTDEANGEALTGAKFRFKGLTLKGEKGIYTVVSYDPNGTDDSGTEVEVGTDGKIIIGGIDKSITLKATETVAPEGYNKKTGTIDVPTVQMAETTTTNWKTTTTYYDADGNVVDEETEGGTSTETKEFYNSINQIPSAGVVNVPNTKGVELPSTGGIGTTIFHVLGGALVLGAGIILIAKKRVNS